MIVVSLKCVDKLLLKLYINYIKIIIEKLKIKNFSIIKLPIKTKRITFLKSPHVNKKAQEHFYLHLYKNVLLLKMKHSNILKKLLLNKPKNVLLKFKYIKERE